MLEKALALARDGYAVFPLTPNSKRPLPNTTGFHEATRDEATIRAWWSAVPDANIGIYPWACEPKLIVVDLDIGEGKDGFTTWEVLELTYGAVGDGLQVETPRGGRHLYLEAPPGCPDVGNSAGRLGRGVDIRAAHGYVVGPGSRIDGAEYKASGSGFAPAPEWLVRMAGEGLARDESAAELAPGVAAWDLPANVERAAKWLRLEAANGRVAVSGNGGNNFTYRTAEVVRDFGISAAECAALMLENWNQHCEPPWSAPDLEAIVTNAYAYAKHPAGAARTAAPDAVEQMAQAAAKRAREVRPPKPGRFHVLKWSGIMAMPPVVWMIEGTVPQHGIVEIYGPWGSYKSFLTLDMALALSTGLPWAERPVAKPYRVLYVAGEGAYGLRQRSKAWAASRGIEAIDNFAIVPAMPMFANDDDLRDFGDAVKAFAPEVFVFDTAAHAMAGLDENSQKDAGLFMARLYEVRDAFKAAVFIVHHSGKDDARGSRGSTAIPAAVDTLFHVSTPQPLQAVMRMEKQKDGERWSVEQGFQATSAEGSLVFRPANVTPPSKNDLEQVRVDALVAILEKMPVGRTIDTKPLAFEMARILNPTLDADDADKLGDTLAKWLRRSAAHGRLAHTLSPYIAQAGDARNSHLWRHPEKAPPQTPAEE